MHDEKVLEWLMGITTYIARLHYRLRQAQKPETNAGPRYYEANVYEAYDEGFARWMGWRGQEEQEREMRKQKGPQSSTE
jgi:hypothetical protein